MKNAHYSTFDSLPKMETKFISYDLLFESFFSILIPSYHTNKNFLIEAIESVYNQTFSDFEVVVCEQGEEDLSWLLDLFPSINIIHQDSPSLYKARIALLEHCHGRFVIFLDSDDLLAKNCLSFLKEKIDAYGSLSYSYVFCYKHIKFKQTPEFEEKPLDHSVSIINNKDFLNKVVSEGGDITSISMKCFFKQVFRWYVPADLFQAEDKFFCIQLSMQASGAILLNENFYFYRENDQSGQVKSSIKNIYDLASVFFFSLQLNISERQKAILLNQWHLNFSIRCILGLKNKKFSHSQIKIFLNSPINRSLVKSCLKLKRNILSLDKSLKNRTSFFLYSHKLLPFYLLASKLI